MLGYICDAGYISDGGYMGSAPCPQCRDAAAIRGVRTRREDAGYLGSQPQAPNISDGVYLGECPSPEVFMGSAPYLRCQTLPLFGESEPIQRRKLFGEPTPSPQYLRWHVFGRKPKPKCVYGERPMPPKTDASAFRENARTPIIPFFTFNLHSIHDTELQLERHGVLSTAY